jgi:hypothetical protein
MYSRGEKPNGSSMKIKQIIWLLIRIHIKKKYIPRSASTPKDLTLTVFSFPTEEYDHKINNWIEKRNAP